MTNNKLGALIKAADEAAAKGFTDINMRLTDLQDALAALRAQEPAGYRELPGGTQIMPKGEAQQLYGDSIEPVFTAPPPVDEASEREAFWKWIADHDDWPMREKMNMFTAWLARARLAPQGEERDALIHALYLAKAALDPKTAAYGAVVNAIEISKGKFIGANAAPRPGGMR